MHFALLVIGCLVIGTTLWDIFETIALPRTATHKLRLTRLYYSATWTCWLAIARQVRSDKRREHFLALYGPLSVFGLLAVWARRPTTDADAGSESTPPADTTSGWRAHATFAIARHAAVDLTQVLASPLDPPVDRLPPDELAAVQDELLQAGLTFSRPADAAAELLALRRLYEPYVFGLSSCLMTSMPPWRHATPARHNWHTNPRRKGGAHL
jgi:hypothetical protein